MLAEAMSLFVCVPVYMLRSVEDRMHLSPMDMDMCFLLYANL